MISWSSPQMHATGAVLIPKMDCCRKILGNVITSTVTQVSTTQVGTICGPWVKTEWTGPLTIEGIGRGTKTNSILAGGDLPMRKKLTRGRSQRQFQSGFTLL